MIAELYAALPQELATMRIRLEPKSLEDLLDSLAYLDFPVSPSITHSAEQEIVEFIAESDRVEQVRKAMDRAGVDPCLLRVQPLCLSGAFR